jgi:hypothetical protein
VADEVPTREIDHQHETKMIEDSHNHLDEALGLLILESKHFISTRRGRRFLLLALDRVKFLIEEETQQENARLRQIVRNSNLMPNLPTEGRRHAHLSTKAAE